MLLLYMKDKTENVEFLFTPRLGKILSNNAYDDDDDDDDDESFHSTLLLLVVELHL
jgi:hypothetical protein